MQRRKWSIWRVLLRIVRLMNVAKDVHYYELPRRICGIHSTADCEDCWLEGE